MKPTFLPSLDLRKIEISDEAPAFFTPEVVVKKNELYKKLNTEGKTSKTLEQEIRVAITQYSEVPVFHNYLAMLYFMQGNREERDRLFLETIKKFPNYVYGWATLIKYYILEKRLDELDQILENQPLHIGAQFPNLRSFTTYEIHEYSESLIYYYAAKGEIKLVNSYGRILNDLLPVDQVKKIEKKAKEIEKSYSLYHLAHLPFFDEPQHPNLLVKPQILEKTEERPILHHEELYQFYEFVDEEYEPSDEYLANLSTLPRETVVEDLVKMWLDTIQRFDYYNEEGIYYKLPHFVLALLTHFDATEKLEELLPFFRQDEEFYEFWIGDWNENFVYFIGELIRKDLDTVKAFLCEPNRHIYLRHIFNDALEYLYQFYEELRPRISQIYGEIMTYFLESTDKENLLDAEFNGFLVGNLLNLGLKEHLGLIQKMCEIDWVDETVQGGWEDIQAEMLNEDKTHKDYYAFPTWGEKVNLVRGDATATEYVRSEKKEIEMERWLKKLEEEVEEIDFVKKMPEKITSFSEKSPWDKIGRNDKVSVQYPNGKIETNIKFKKVEADLRAGKCQLC